VFPYLCINPVAPNLDIARRIKPNLGLVMLIVEDSDFNIITELNLFDGFASEL